FLNQRSQEMPDYLADDAQFSDLSFLNDQTRPEFIAGLQEFWGAFTELKGGTKETWAAGNYVLDIFDWEAVNTGDLPSINLKATNKPVKLTDFQLLELRDDKVVRFVAFKNGLSVAKQLGLIP